MMTAVVHIFSLLVFVYLCTNILYLFIAAIAGHFRIGKKYLPVSEKKRIAVLITSFREDGIILKTATAACGHDYPRDRFDVFLAADQLQPETLSSLRQLPMTVTEVHFEVGSKAKSLNRLLNMIDGTAYDIALILDGDNIMEKGFMEQVNTVFQKGFQAVQGHRTAKNKNTPVAILDALSEEINNHLFRKAQRAMGLSSATIGSGMGFEFKKLREVYNKPGIVDNPACDREVDFEMMKAGIVVEYLESALVYDEKVAVAGVYRNQRRRWLESQIIHLKLFLSEKVPHKDRNYWNKLSLNLIPPRLLLLVIISFSVVTAAVNDWFHLNLLYPPWYAWVILAIVYFLSLLLSIPAALYSFSTLRALTRIPTLLLSMIKALISMRSARKEFVHTPKSYTGNSQDPS